jgi:signal transduction histidine kinase
MPESAGRRRRLPAREAAARWYTFVMTQQLSHPAPVPSVPPFLRTIAAALLLWCVISALGALQTYADNLRVGIDSHYPALLVTWFIEYAAPLVVLSAGLTIALARWPALIRRPHHVLLLFVALVLVFQPAQWTWIAWLRGYLPVAGMEEARRLLWKMLLVGWFTTTGTFAAVLAVSYWRQVRERELAWQRAQTDMLNLQLALEQQRMGALRAQLEPHFLFNALNAISALVRDDDKALALGGIGRLSELLRYALSATRVESVSVADELQFVRDYLELQRLRHGERLRVKIEGAGPSDPARLFEVGCPPLLLQPLIENAIRHHVECRADPGDIRLAFARDGGFLRVVVSNPLEAPANPGAGMGLSNTRDRLALMHPDATLDAGARDGQFVAEVRLPLTRSD